MLGAHLLLKMWLHLFNGSGETRKACTQVLRVEHGNIALIRAISEYDDVHNALTNVEVLADDEYQEVELLFDAETF